MKQLQERMQRYGTTSLSMEELLAYLLFNGTAHKDPLAHAHRLLERYSVRRLRTAEIAELCADGLTTAQAQRLKAACELLLRFTLGETERPPRIASAEDAVALLKPLMMHLEQETLRVLVLDTKSQLVANELLYTGTVNSSVLRVAEVFRPAIVRNSPSILLAHNHPSGDSTPSSEDRDVTQQLVQAGKLLEIEVVDHLIIGNPRYTSLQLLMKW